MNLIVKNYLSRLSPWGTPLLRQLIRWNHRYAILLLILVVGALLRLGYWQFNRPIPSRDAVTYASLIAEWYQSGSFESVGNRFILQRTAMPPFLLFAGKLLMQCGFSQYTGGILVNMLLGCLFPIVMFGCAGRLWPECAAKACLVAGLAAIQPSLIEFSTDILREMSYLFFVACAFYFWLGMYKQKSLCSAIWVGVMTALATLCRYEGFELYPLLLLSLIIGVCFRNFRWQQGMLMASMNSCGALFGYGMFFFIAGIEHEFILVWATKSFRYLGVM